MTESHAQEVHRIAVADTGPLLALAKVDALWLLYELYSQILASPTVYTEAVTAGLARNAPDATLLSAAFAAGDIQVRAPTLSTLPIPIMLHPGETESLQLAIELQVDSLLVDDLAARHAAEMNFDAAHVAVRVKGTLGVIVTAYRHQLLNHRAAVGLINVLKSRSDVWLNADLCDRVIVTLEKTELGHGLG